MGISFATLLVVAAVAGASVAGAVWLSEPNDDELLVRIVQGAPNGKVVGAASLSGGKAGERRFVFRPSVVLRQGGTYFLKVMAGAPGTTRGAVQCQTPNPQTKGYSEHGASTDDMAYELFFQRRVTSWSHAVSVRPQTPEDIAYEERLNDALRAKRDVLGEALIARPGGPTYEGIAPLVRPLMLVGANITTSGVYYLVFGEPDGVTGGGDCALHVADGSEIISRHHRHGRRTQFYVGAGGDELFGASRTGLRRQSRLDGGYYPILVTECRDARGVRYRHESLATRIWETSSLVSFIKITVERAESRAKTTFFRIKVGKRGLHVEGQRLVEDGKTVLAFSPGGRYEEPFLTYRPDLAAAGRPSALLITHFTPRSWLADGKEIRVVSAPTMFGAVSFDIRSRLKRHAIDAVVDLPKRNPPRVLTLRLRTPGKRRMEQVLLDGRPFERFDPGCEQIDLSGVTGRLRVEVRYFK